MGDINKVQTVVRADNNKSCHSMWNGHQRHLDQLDREWMETVITTEGLQLE
jgi:hypothetical protein